MFRLQAAQNSMLSYEKLFPGTTTYHHCVVVEIIGEISRAHFSEALHYLTERHAVLRSKLTEDATNTYLQIPTNNGPSSPPSESTSSTSMGSTGNLPFRVIQPSSDYPLPELTDFYDYLLKINEVKLVEEAFPLYEGPLWRSALIKHSPNRYYFLLVQHHIITDTHSTGILLRDLSVFYNALVTNETTHLPPIPDFGNFNLQLPSSEHERRLTYWKSALHGLSTVQLPTDKTEEVFRFTGRRIPFGVDAALVTALKANIPGYSFNMIMLGVLYTFLFRYTHEENIALGITSANRRHDHAIARETLNNIANCFINSLCIRLHLDPSLSFMQLLSRIKAKQKEALENQLPIDEVMQSMPLDDKKSLGTASPFNIMLVVNDRIPIPTLSLAGTTSSAPYEVDTKHSKFPYMGINLSAHDNGSYQGFVEFNTDLFNEETITELIIPRLLQILGFISNSQTNNLECSLTDIPLLLPREIHLLKRLNATTVDKPGEKYVQDYFNEVAKQFPDKDALVYHNEYREVVRVTYRECNELSTALGVYLRNLNKVSRLQTVGICLKRSHHLFTTALAVLKAGYTFVMLDTDQAAARNYKISAAEIQVVIVDQHTESLFADSKDITIVNIVDKAVSDRLIETEHRPVRNPDGSIVNLDNAVAYIMFTSGSTGQPKGVKCTHTGFSNLLYALEEYLHEYNIEEPLKVISTAPCIFDAFLWDLLLALASKGTVHIRAQPPGRNAQAENGLITERIIFQEGINAGAFLPTDFRLFSDEAIKKFKFLVTMGSAAYLETLKRIRMVSPTTLLINGYGPTETTIDCAHHAYRDGQLSSIIGKPLRNMKIHILDPYLRVCPLGAAGEIYIEGPGVAKGYLAQETMLENKFLSLSFNENKQAFEHPSPSSRRHKLYKTGDLAVNLLIEGQALISIIGRIDREVKIFGNRINLGEIEAILRQNEEYVQDVVLVGRQAGVIAYVIPPPGKQDITAQEMQVKLRDFLNKTPCKPVAKPQVTMIMHSFPLTANGKINLQELPPPTVPVLEQPKTALQTTLRQLWGITLGLPETSISISKPFEDYGGNSLSRVTLVDHINNHREVLGLTRTFKISSLSPATTITTLETSVMFYQRLRTHPTLLGSPQRSVMQGAHTTHGTFFKTPTPRGAMSKSRSPETGKSKRSPTSSPSRPLSPASPTSPSRPQPPSPRNKAAQQSQS